MPVPSFIHAHLRAVARQIVMGEQCASSTLLQRHLRIDEALATNLMRFLEIDGIVSAPAVNGTRELMPAYQEGCVNFRSWALSDYAGCDGGDPRARVWVLGVEHGDSRSDGPGHEAQDDGYPIARQRTYRYNVQVFKLLAAIGGKRVEDWMQFAEREQPFVDGRAGYFKGNLYPYPCWKDFDWSDTAQSETGFSSKERYRAWCRNHRFSLLRRWIEAANPELIIATGTTRRDDFLSVSFAGDAVGLQEHQVAVGGRRRTFYSACHGGRLLVVLPHLSGSPLFRGHAVLQSAGEQIAELRRAVRALAPVEM